jgi:murein DD-endopeptidase MepM/ murein hydrolase activator NlpD
VSAGASPPAGLAPGPRSLDGVVAEVVRRVNEGDGGGVHALYGDQMRASFPEDSTRRFVAAVAGAIGRIVSSEKEDAATEARADYRLHGERSDGRMELAIDPDGRITLLRITPAPAAEPPVVRSTIALVLPFHGDWFVDWGGDTPANNHHLGHGSQRRAADLVIRGAGAKTYRGDGKSNADYLAYGSDVLSVADGTVTTVVDGVPENTPGTMNRNAVFGNFVAIRHTDSLYSLYAHLQPGKMRVQVGTTVKAETVIGACGNSGNSTEPHLHFQLEDGPRPEDSWGVEAIFAGVLVTREGKRERMAQYAFRRGDVVGESAGRACLADNCSVDSGAR